MIKLDRTAAVIASMVLIIGCTTPYDEQLKDMMDPNSDWAITWQACDDAQTYNEAFGTPDNRGPCWGEVQTASVSGVVETYQMTTIQNRPAVVTYVNGKLDAVTVGTSGPLL